MGFKSPGPFLNQGDKDRINKRVGHITLSEVRRGKEDWDDSLTRSLPKLIDASLCFYRFLLDQYLPASSPQVRRVKRGISILVPLGGKS